MRNLLQKIRKEKSKGQATLELALVLPIFLILMVGIFEVARIFFYNVSVNNASREAARYAASSGCPSSTACAAGDTHYYQDCTGIKNRAITKAPGIGLTTNDITISYDSGPGTTTSPTPGSCSTPPSLLTDNYHRVVIEVKKHFTWIIPIPGFNDIDITSKTFRTILVKVD